MPHENLEVWCNDGGKTIRVLPRISHEPFRCNRGFMETGRNASEVRPEEDTSSDMTVTIS